MYPEYETFVLGSVKRLEKMVQEQAQAERIARIVEVSVAKQVATSPGQKNILIAEVIEVEADNSSVLGAEESKESGGKEQEGTSHAQDQASTDGGENFVSLSSVSLLSCTDNEGNEAHPPIRKVRGLTPQLKIGRNKIFL